MITADRWGNALSSDALQRALASESSTPLEVSARFFDCHGQFTNSTVWTAYNLPPDAIVLGNASHHDKLDEISSTLQIQIFADMLPPELAALNGPQQGFRLEVDLAWGPGPANHWPYFTGYVTSPARKWTAKDGIAPTIITVAATGVLNERTRALNLPAAMIPLDTLLQSGKTYPFALPNLQAVCVWRTSCFASGGSASGSTDYIPQAIVTFGFPQLLVLSPNPDFSSPYASTYYTVNATNGPPSQQGSVTWNGTGGPAAGTLVYAKFVSVEYFMVPKLVAPYGNTMPSGYGGSNFFIVPAPGLVYGQILPRSPWDNYQTTIAALPAANEITPADPTGYNSTTLASIGEFVTITKGDGSEAIYAISSVSAGVITLTANWSGLAVGDAIRLSTLEPFPSWVEFGALAPASSYAQQAMPISAFEGLYNYDGPNGSTCAPYYLNAACAQTDTSIQLASVGSTSPYAPAVGRELLIAGELMYITSVSGSYPLWTVGVLRGIGGSMMSSSYASLTPVYQSALKQQLQFNPQMGIAVPACHHYAPSSDGYSTAWGMQINAQLISGPESGNTNNQIENIVSHFLEGGTFWPNGCFASSDLVVDNISGVYGKNFPIYATNGLDFLKNLKKNALKPNTYVRDAEDGKVHIRTYVQASTPDWTFSNAQAIEEETLPDPVTAVAVISTDADAQNVAAKWFSRTYNIGNGGTILAPATPNAHYAVDGQTSNAATQNQVGVPAYFVFDIPEISPIQLIPLIDSIEVYGSGYMTAFLQRATPGIDGAQSGRYANALAYHNYGAIIPGANFLYLAGTSSPTTISSDQIARAMSSVLNGFVAGTEPWYYDISNASSWTNGVGPLQLVIRIDSDDSSGLPPIAAQVSEIVINVKRQTGWLASFSDNAALVPSAYQPSDTSSDFGDVWVQSDTQRAESWRWAPTTWMQRSAAQYLPADLTKILVTAGGSGYTNGNDSSLTPAGTAIAIQQVSGGALTYMSLVPGDANRTAVPAIGIGGTGTGAAATPVLYTPPRLAVIEMQGITQYDCRQMAEASVDEYQHQSRQYKVTGPYFPWARLGDTALVYAPDGKTFSDGSSSKMLLLFGRDDSLDGMCQYTFCDYGA